MVTEWKEKTLEIGNQNEGRENAHSRDMLKVQSVGLHGSLWEVGKEESQ